MSSIPQLPPEIQPEFITLPHKPNSPLSITFFPALGPSSPTPLSTTPQHLVVFINGLGLPASSWLSTTTHLRSTLNTRCPALLTYDRYGQGLTTSRDPLDSLLGKEEGYGHDFMNVATDLHSLIQVICSSKLYLSLPEKGDEEGEENIHLLLVSASIGTPIARLYIQTHPGIVSGLICLDSNIANANYSEILPAPDSPGFSKHEEELLCEDCTLEQYIEAREKLIKMFDFDVKNAEGLDRRNSAALLPRADGPRLVGTEGEGKGPCVCIVGHDPETFVELSWRMMGTPRSLSRLNNRYWAEYNEGLRKITDDDRCGEVVIAKGCGHFIQKDDPEFVAKEVMSMMERLGW